MTDWNQHEDAIDDAISDSIDMDWTSRTGAKAVVAWLNENAAASAPSSLAGGEVTLGQRAFEQMRDHNDNDAPLAMNSTQQWSDLSDREREKWSKDAAERPHLYGLGFAALSPEAPARVGVEALRTALIKARSELAIQYCYSAGRMGIAGCYPELAEKYGGSAIVQEIDAVLALTPRHEAPARDGVALDKRIADAAERDRRERDKAFRGESYEPLTPRHEAPFFIKDGEDPAEFRALGKRLADTDHEAPAEGAGEIEHVAKWHEDRAAFLTSKAADDEWSETEAQLHRDMAVSIRARSSAPEGEEALGNLLAVIHGDGGHRALEVGTKQAALEAEKIVAGLFAAPSADKLRIAVEALEPFAAVMADIGESEDDADSFRNPRRDYAKSQGISVGHIRRADQALAALKAEGK